MNPSRLDAMDCRSLHASFLHGEHVIIVYYLFNQGNISLYISAVLFGITIQNTIGYPRPDRVDSHCSGVRSLFSLYELKYYNYLK